MARKKPVWWIAGVILATALAVGITKPSSPEGRYVASVSIGAEGDFYWQLADGKLFFVCYEYPDAKSGFRGGTYRKAERWTYTKTNGGWFLFSEPRSNNVLPSRIETSWVGVRVIPSGGSGEFFRRRLIPGARPEWVFDHLPWCIQ